MELIDRITDADFEYGEIEYLDRISRYAARGVVIKPGKIAKVAMIHMSSNGFYKLPGGGMESNESKEDAFRREVLEEVGYRVDIIHHLGIIEEHKVRNNFKQVSYCFIGETRGEKQETQLTKSEKFLGFQVKWMTLPQARRAMCQSIAKCNEYTMRFLLKRDKQIIERAMEWMDQFKENKGK